MSQENDMWDFLIKRIEQGKCALVIGPEIAFAGEGQSFQESLQSYLNQELQGKTFDFFGEDEFIAFDSTKDRLLTLFKIQNFFEIPRAEDLYQKLAQVPFHLVINLSPDTYLKKAFDQMGFNYDFQYYDKNKNAAGSQFLNIPIQKDQPLIYNLMGNIEDEESLIFTYDDLFSYLENIFGHFKLPEKVRLALQNTSSFIFIGVKFRKWYLRLLLRLLGLHHQDKLINACMDQHIPQEATTFYTRHFEISFLDYHSGAFVEQLFLKSQPVLRKASKSKSVRSKSDLLDSIREHIRNNEIEESIEELKLYSNSQQIDDLILFQSRFEKATNDLHKGKISHSSAELVFNNVKDSILTMANEISAHS
jgi:hypothetical protein